MQEFAKAKFAESVDVAVNLGIDASKSDQQVRGSTVMPHGIGKAVRVAVFTSGKNQDAARAAGADIVIVHLHGGWEYDHLPNADQVALALDLNKRVGLSRSAGVLPAPEGVETALVLAPASEGRWGRPPG